MRHLPGVFFGEVFNEYLQVSLRGFSRFGKDCGSTLVDRAQILELENGCNGHAGGAMDVR